MPGWVGGPDTFSSNLMGATDHVERRVPATVTISGRVPVKKTYITIFRLKKKVLQLHPG